MWQLATYIQPHTGKQSFTVDISNNVSLALLSGFCCAIFAFENMIIKKTRNASPCIRHSYFTCKLLMHRYRDCLRWNLTIWSNFQLLLCWCVWFVWYIRLGCPHKRRRISWLGSYRYCLVRVKNVILNLLTLNSRLNYRFLMQIYP